MTRNAAPHVEDRARPVRRRLTRCFALGGLVWLAPLRAQTPVAPVPCNGEIVTEVDIRSHAPTFGGLFARSHVLGQVVTTMHVATAPSVIRNFVLLKPGDRCTMLLRRETERVLRAQPFLADAAVTAYPDGPGHVRIEVATIDEPSFEGSLGLTGVTPYVNALAFGNANLGGRGIYIVSGWREGNVYRDTFWANYTNYQLFRRPYQLQVHAHRDEHGYGLATVVSRPFFSEIQRYAWRALWGTDVMLVPFRSPDRPRISLGLQRQYFDVGAGVRVGRTGHFALFGLSLSSDRAIPAGLPEIVTDTGIVADSTSALLNRYRPYHSTRINVLAGYRHVNFLRVNGFDALTGAQDVRRGIQIGTTVGRGLHLFGATRYETFVAADLYGGVGSAKSFAAVEVLGEGRLDTKADEWDGVLSSGRLAMYLKPHPRHTVVASVEYAAGWRQRVPFQLSLGDIRGGVRGYGDTPVGGSQRLVGRVEERWRVGTIRGTGDAGVALFSDVGRLWAGDAPLGRNTPYEPSLGVGILGAIPPRSQRLWRLDIAFPLRHAMGAGRWEVRISSADRTRAFYLEPNDVRNVHERTVPASVFTWP